MRRELESWLFFYLEPRERMRAANPIKEVRHIGLMGEELASYLNTLKATQPRQFKAIQRALRTLLPGAEVDTRPNSLGEVEISLVESGVPVSARLLSEGTLRLLGLLSLVGSTEPPALIGFEEPENGVHPTRLALVAELLRTQAGLGRTQYLVTTHSPLLLDLLPEEALMLCRKEGAATQIAPFRPWGELGRRAGVDAGLRGDEVLKVSERILRGDV
jgi:predicted ATPase